VSIKEPNPFLSQPKTITTTTKSTTYAAYTTTTAATYTTYTTNYPSTSYLSLSTVNNQPTYSTIPSTSSTTYFTTTTIPQTYRVADPVQATYSTRPSFMEVLRSNDLTVMATLLTESGLDQMLNQKSYGEFTMFVPTDKAFNEFFEPMGGVIDGIEKLKQNKKEMKKVNNTHLALMQLYE
jgi:uncharacterized surface protein with fasciclin (FAS1) repeats